MSSLLGRALPVLFLLAFTPVLAARLNRRWRAELGGDGGRLAALGAMTFALAAALELVVGRGLHLALEGLGWAPTGLVAALLVGVAVASAHEPLRFATYRHFVDEGQRTRPRAVLFGLGYGAAMAALVAAVLLFGLLLEALGGDRLEALGFGADVARRADLRSAIEGLEPWRPWLVALDQLAWLALHVGLSVLAFRGWPGLVAALAVHAVVVAAIGWAGEHSLELETAAHGAAAVVGLSLARLGRVARTGEVSRGS